MLETMFVQSAVIPSGVEKRVHLGILAPQGDSSRLLRMEPHLDASYSGSDGTSVRLDPDNRIGEQHSLSKWNCKLDLSSICRVRHGLGSRLHRLSLRYQEISEEVDSSQSRTGGGEGL